MKWVSVFKRKVETRKKEAKKGVKKVVNKTRYYQPLSKMNGD
jgi:hypothetical protein